MSEWEPIQDGWESIPAKPKAAPPPSHDTLGVVGTYSGRGTKNFFNLPRDAIAGVVRHLPYIAEFLTNPGMTGMRASGLPTDPIAPKGVKSGLGEAADWIERTFDVGKTYDALGIPHRPPPPGELSMGQRMLGKAAEVASGTLPITAALSRGVDVGRQFLSTTAGSALAGPGYELGGPAGELAAFLAGAGAVGSLGRAAAAPTERDLYRQAKGFYLKGEAAPPIAHADIRTLRSEISSDLAAMRFDPESHPKVAEALGHIARREQRLIPVDIKTFDVMRNDVRKAFKGASEDEGVMLRQMLERVEEMLPAEMRKAAELTRRAKRSESLGTVVDRAESRIGATAYGNALRNEVSSLLRSGKEMRYFRPDEADMVGEIVNSPVLNALRVVSKVAPSRGAFNVAGHVVAGTADQTAAILSAILSEAAKAAATRMTSSRITNLQEYIRRGGPAPADLDMLRAVLPALGAQER